MFQYGHKRNISLFYSDKIHSYSAKIIIKLKSILTDWPTDWVTYHNGSKHNSRQNGRHSTGSQPTDGGVDMQPGDYDEDDGRDLGW